jgi:hypothetical protein
VTLLSTLLRCRTDPDELVPDEALARLNDAREARAVLHEAADLTRALLEEVGHDG